MTDLVRVSITGALPSGEEWSINPSFFLPTGTTVGYTDAAALVTAINGITPGTGVRAMWNPYTTLRGCRVEARLANGDLESQAEGERGAFPQGTGTNNHPFQTAIAVSLRTAHPGPSGRGRIYWPATGAVISDSTLRPNSTLMTALVTDTKTYLKAIESAIAAQALVTTELAVWSRLGAQLYPVHTLLAGDVLDSQRRRRDALVETYQSVAY